MASTTRSVTLVPLIVTELDTIEDVDQKEGKNFFVRKKSILKLETPFLSGKSKNRDAHGDLREKAKKVLKNHFIFFRFGETVVGREGGSEKNSGLFSRKKIHLKKVPLEGWKPEEGLTKHRAVAQ